MTHRSENCASLTVEIIPVLDQNKAIDKITGFNDVCLVALPPHLPNKQNGKENNWPLFVARIAEQLGPDATLVVLGEPADLVHVHASLSSFHYQLWIAIKRQTPVRSDSYDCLPNHHFGVLVYTAYPGTLRHTITRIQYTYCPACDKTTKDYGGKKHTYNSYGTLISDIWRDIACDLEGNISPIIQRFADLFGLENYNTLYTLDCRKTDQKAVLPLKEPETTSYIAPSLFSLSPTPQNDDKSRLILGDCLENLYLLPDNSVDFAFIDPPYNLRKKYNNYSDDLSIQEYFTWCDEWISEVARILRPGRTIAILNIPLWAIRHFLHMETILTFQNWIVWDALSFPVRKIMPAHYAIVCFSKGKSRPLPGLTGKSGPFTAPNSVKTFLPLAPLAEGYCLRASCVRQRNALGMTDRGQLTDLWWDIHRLKHNSRRVDHPCQLPPQLMYRLISIFTEPGEMVMDCFNGAGTTSLTAHQSGRQYIGIELSEKYFKIAQERHEEIRVGLDPFRKADRKLTEKNSRVARMPKRTYEVPKKTLQLEVRRVARELGRLPTRDDMIRLGRYPINYYDEYFASWGEVCAAARHDGMSEVREREQATETSKLSIQLSLFGRGEVDAKRH